ncbi:hypothetical protein BX600DRAFT_530817 [Xylariales sp. PMI_506]|nr:hypothetical protein BX600DRAFT_530817 [Xylariales sp. PMI_506]
MPMQQYNRFELGSPQRVDAEYYMFSFEERLAILPSPPCKSADDPLSLSRTRVPKRNAFKVVVLDTTSAHPYQRPVPGQSDVVKGQPRLHTVDSSSTCHLVETAGEASDLAPGRVFPGPRLLDQQARSTARALPPATHSFTAPSRSPKVMFKPPVIGRAPASWSSLGRVRSVPQGGLTVRIPASPKYTPRCWELGAAAVEPPPTSYPGSSPDDARHATLLWVLGTHKR